MDGIASILCLDEQLGVEEPASILDARQNLACRIAPNRLEAALSIDKFRLHRSANNPVVAARNHITLEAAGCARLLHQARARHHSCLTHNQRGDH